MENNHESQLPNDDSQEIAKRFLELDGSLIRRQKEMLELREHGADEASLRLAALKFGIIDLNKFLAAATMKERILCLSPFNAS
jgi:hypothetical protein